MKKIIFCIIAAIVVMFGCKTKKDEKTPAPPNPKSSDTSVNKKGSLSDYKTLSIRNIYLDKRLDSLQFFGGLEPKDPQEFEDDSTKFDDEFLKTGYFIMSDSFPISLDTMYSKMQYNLGITDRSEYDPFGNETVNGIRIYPALTESGGKKILYMVLLGEESREGATFGEYDMFTMLTKNYYEVRNGKFTEISTDAGKEQAKNDIAAFRTFWNTKYPQDPPVEPIENPNLNRSYCFSIERYYHILSTAHLNIYKGLTTPSLKYGIIFYPCLKNKKMYFVLKGYKLSGSGPQIQLNPFNNKPFFDNMDVCPEKCPAEDILQ